MEKGYMEKRGQAAMEFLLTYGWAIIAVFIVIGALVYFDVLSPENFLSEKCVVSSGLVCDDYTVGSNGIQVRLQNSAGRDMVIKEVKFVSDAVAGECSSGQITGLLQAGESKSFAVVDPAGCSFSGSKEKNNYDLVVEYSWLDSLSFTHTFNGELFSRVEQGAEISPGGNDSGYVGYGSSVAGYWKFNDDLKDSSGSSNGVPGGELFNDGSVSGAASATGKFGSALSFDGSDDYVSVPDNNVFDFGTTQDFTISAWIKKANPLQEAMPIVTKDANASEAWRGWQLNVHDDVDRALVLILNDWKRYWGVVNGLSDSNWRHVAVSVDRDSYVRLYIDGALDRGYNNVSTAGINVYTSTPLKIGASSSGNRKFNGLVDEVRIYDSALAQADIQQDMASAYQIKKSIGVWNFNSATSPGRDTHSFLAGHSGNALSLYGNNYAGMPSLGITTSFTLAAWVKPKLQPDYITIAGYKEGGSPRRLLIGSNGKILAQIYGGSFFSVNPVPDDAWSHVAYVFDKTAGTQNIYINGVLDASGPTSAPKWDNAFYVGYYGEGAYQYRGLIDEFIVYDRALSGQEVRALAQS